MGGRRPLDCLYCAIDDQRVSDFAFRTWKVALTQSDAGTVAHVLASGMGRR
jgi:hypothetical protein